MQTYEFTAKPENGAIPIPEQYKHLITDNDMVVVSVKKPLTYTSGKDNIHRKTDLLPPPTMKTRGFKYNREEANER